MAYEDDFGTIENKQKYGEQNEDFAAPAQYVLPEGAETYEERFFHPDEYNRDYYAGLRESETAEQEDGTDSAEELLGKSVSGRSVKNAARSVIKKAAQAVQMAGMITLASAVVASGSPQLLQGFTQPKEEPLTEHVHVEAGEWQVSCAATCSQTGQKILLCLECGETLKEEPIPLLDHTPGEWQVTSPATCIHDGAEERLCALCAAVLDTRVIAAGQHLAGDWIVDTAATCTVPGHRHTQCVACGMLLSEEEITAAHNEVKDPAQPASCDKTGLTEGSHCSVCGTVILQQQTVPQLQHTVVTDAAVAGTCAVPGQTEGSHCSVCGEVLVAQKPITVPHSSVTDPAVAGTCYTTGLTEGSHCSVCGQVLVAQQETPEVHDLQTLQGYEATCMRPGLTEGSYCAICQQTIKAQQEIPLAPHSEVVVPGQAATCVEMGFGEYIYCSECQQTLQVAEQLPVEPDAHKWVADPTGAPDVYVCEYCGITQ
ncbi:MAG: hypothetical protein IJE98_05190 [Oscillospiraceae bacterium]|nr:hypothetical protein [Oscillospiraceae bacterium]